MQKKTKTPSVVDTGTILDDPDFLDVACSYLTNGGTLTALARMYHLEYDQVLQWIRKTSYRTKRIEDALFDRKEWARERVLNEIKNLSFWNIKEIINEDGSVKPIQEWPDNCARSVRSIEVHALYDGQGTERAVVGQAKKIQFWDKMRALELLGKNLSMFADRVEHTGQVKLEDLILGKEV